MRGFYNMKFMLLNAIFGASDENQWIDGKFTSFLLQVHIEDSDAENVRVIDVRVIQHMSYLPLQPTYFIVEKHLRYLALTQKAAV